MINVAFSRTSLKRYQIDYMSVGQHKKGNMRKIHTHVVL